MSEKKKILVVDDDIDFIKPIQSFLKAHGYSVMVAYDGSEGIKKACTEKPDLILLDVMMTRIGEGFDTFRELRARVETKNIPVIMITLINTEVPFRFGPDKIWLPVDGFIEKPVSSEKLLEQVEQIL